MPHRLKKRQEKIQEKRKKNPWREFVKEIASWGSIMFYKQEGLISKFPFTSRIHLIHQQKFYQERDNLVNQEDILPEKNFFQDFHTLRNTINLPSLVQR